jgi:hypothetical protein
MTAGTEVELYKPGGFLALNHDTSQVVEAITAIGTEASKWHLTQARVPGPGSKRWKVTYGSGKEADPEVLTGVIVSLQPARSYWAKPFEGGGDSPDCASYDGGQTGVAHTEKGPGMECAKCPMNQWDSGPNGTGKACRETKEILLLPTDNLLPILVSVPPASLGPLSGFLLEQAGMNRTFNSFVVELSIDKRNTRNRSDVPYIAAEFKGLLDPAERDLTRAYAGELQAIFARNAMNPNGTDPDPAPAPAAETDEQRVERLAAKYGNDLPE